MFAKIVIAAAFAALPASAFAQSHHGGRYYDPYQQHRGDHREHRSEHREINRDHRDAHREGFYSRGDHRGYHRSVKQQHNRFHYQHPGTRHGERGYYDYYRGWPGYRGW